MYLIQDELPNFQLASFSDVRWYHKRDVIRKELFSLPEDRRGNTQGLLRALSRRCSLFSQ